MSEESKEFALIALAIGLALSLVFTPILAMDYASKKLRFECIGRATTHEAALICKL